MSILNKEEIHLKYIKKAFQIKFGNLYITPKNKSKLDRQKLIKKINKCLEPLPSITEIKKIETPNVKFTSIEMVTFENEESKKPKIESITLSHPLKIMINLPAKNQKEVDFYSGIYNEGIDIATIFGLFYNASIYLFFREVDLSRIYHPGSIDVRDLLIKTISSNKSWNIIEAPPNPLRQNFYLVYLYNTPETREFVGKINITNSNLYWYLSEQNIDEFNELITTLLYHISSSLNIFYHAILLRNKVRDSILELEKIHMSIQSLIQNSMNTNFFKLHVHYKNSKQLEKLISDRYFQLLEFTSKAQYLKERIEIAEKYMDKEFLLSPFKEKIIENLDYHRIDTDTLSRCIDYARAVIQKSYTTKITIVGGIIGIIGSIIGTIILNYLGF